jgi:hypothetical protein
MSNNFFGQGMRSYNNTLKGSTSGVPTKGTGSYSYPIAITSGNIRPLTNNDYRNNAPQKFGLPRPLKWQYRKGLSFHQNVIDLDPNDPNVYINTSRVSRTSTVNLIGLTLDQPGRYSVKHNPKTEINNSLYLDKTCNDCDGVGLIINNPPSRILTDNPQPSVVNKKYCCNTERNARKMVIYASTNLKPNYYNSHYQYLQNRCQTYQQKSFNFTSPLEKAYAIENNNQKSLYAKPGSPLALTNTYIANCYPNIDELIYSENNIVNNIYLILKNQNLLSNEDINRYNTSEINKIYLMNQYISTIENEQNRENAFKIYLNFINNPYIGVPINGPSNPRGCKLVVYKPSNPQFATEGGVSSGTQLLKLTTDTISSNLYSINKLSGSATTSKFGNTPFIYKNKYTTCSNSNSTYMRSYNRQKKCNFSNSKEYIITKCLSQLGNIGGNVNGTFVADVGMSISN